MSTKYKIHDVYIDCHSDTDDMRHILEYDMRGDGFRDYLERSKHGGVYVMDKNNVKFKIEAIKNDSGSYDFSLRKSTSY